MEFETKTGSTQQKFQTGAQRDVSTGKGRYDLLPSMCVARVAKLYERGATHYGANNWTKGIPSTRFMESLLRHAFQYLEGDRSEDHLAAVVFNSWGIMFNEVMVERGQRDAALHDMPDYLGTAPVKTEQASPDMLKALEMRDCMVEFWKQQGHFRVGGSVPTLPRAVVEYYKFVPVRMSEESLVIRMEQAPSTSKLMEIQMVLGRKVIYEVVATDFEKSYAKYQVQISKAEKEVAEKEAEKQQRLAAESRAAFEAQEAEAQSKWDAQQAEFLVMGRAFADQACETESELAYTLDTLREALAAKLKEKGLNCMVSQVHDCLVCEVDTDSSSDFDKVADDFLAQTRDAAARFRREEAPILKNRECAEVPLEESSTVPVQEPAPVPLTVSESEAFGRVQGLLEHARTKPVTEVDEKTRKGIQERLRRMITRSR